MPNQMNEDVRAVFGRQVRRYRLEAGLTQEIASERCGISCTHLSHIEGGIANPTVMVMAALADTLHVDLYKLFIESPASPFL